MVLPEYIGFAYDWNGIGVGKYAYARGGAVWVVELGSDKSLGLPNYFTVSLKPQND